MSTNNKPEPGTFAAEFLERLDKLESNAALMGLSVSDIYRESGVTPYTLVRWRKNPPSMVKSLTDMEAVVEKRMKDAREQGRLPQSE